MSVWFLVPFWIGLVVAVLWTAIVAWFVVAGIWEAVFAKPAYRTFDEMRDGWAAHDRRKHITECERHEDSVAQARRDLAAYEEEHQCREVYDWLLIEQSWERPATLGCPEAERR